MKKIENKSTEEISNEFNRMNVADEHNLNCRLIFITAIAFLIIILLSQ